MKSTNSYKVEQSYEKRIKDFTGFIFVTAVIMELLVMYLGLNTCAYLSEHSNASLIDSFTKSLLIIPKNFLYFIPINYSITPVITICFITALLMFVIYAIEVRKIHHNVNTIKGSAEWQSAIDLTKRFAEFK